MIADTKGGLSARLAALLRLQTGLAVLVAVLSPLVILAVLRGFPGDLEADHRLAPTFALVHGYRLYYPPDSGPALSTLYGPVTALFYLPATLASTPMVAILIGTLWAMIAFFAASFATIRVAAGSIWTKWWQLLGLTLALVWFVGPVERNASHIHADAPALACAALACLFAMRERRTFFAWENELVAALCGTLAVFAKQNMAPVLVAVAIWFALRGGRDLWRFITFSIVLAAVMAGFTVTVLSSPSAFFFNCLVMPTHQPLDKTLLFPALSEICGFGLMLLLIPFAFIARAWARSDAGTRGFLLGRRTPLLILAGVLMVPAAIAGRMKWGGNENSLGLALFFFVLALLAEIAAVRDEAEARLWSIPVLACCLVGLMPAAYFSVKSRPASPIQQAFVYARQHPGQVYFPQFPLVHLMAEGKLYHFSWGLTDRRNAGVPVSDEHFRANISPNAEVLAITSLNAPFESDMTSREGPRVADFAGAAQLPQFEFFAMPPQQTPQK